MSLQIASLNSGSNGNCYYIGNGQEAVLIDAGISCRETVRRMKRLGLQIDKVKAVFISHEHGDHIRGAEGLAAKFKLPVYITSETLRHSHLQIDGSLIQNFGAGEAVAIGGLSVLAFTKLHDAVDPHSFIVSGTGLKVGVFTDIGMPCDQVVYHFRQCHAVFLESNYDEAMLAGGRYSASLKNRISGDKGHLSNTQAAQLFREHRPAFMTLLLLAHLSKENNSPEIAMTAFAGMAGDTVVKVASRYQESDVYTITHGDGEYVEKNIIPPRQLQLF